MQVNFGLTISETSLDDFKQICSVNIDGTWLGMKHCLGKMNDGGAIVNVSSLMVKMGLPEGVGYCASKGAVSMTKSVALEAAERKNKGECSSSWSNWTTMVGGGEGGDEILKTFLFKKLQ